MIKVYFEMNERTFVLYCEDYGGVQSNADFTLYDYFKILLKYLHILDILQNGPTYLFSFL